MQNTIEQNHEFSCKQKSALFIINVAAWVIALARIFQICFQFHQQELFARYTGKVAGVYVIPNECVNNTLESEKSSCRNMVMMSQRKSSGKHINVMQSNVK